jgi:hypothetical protein
MSRLLLAILAVLAVAPAVIAHSWIEQLRNINEKGQYVGEYGYPRGMVGRTDPGFTGDSMNWRLPKDGVFIDDKTPLCHTSQTKPVQSQKKYPRLQAVPGGSVAMRYAENGHVTIPQPEPNIGKPKRGGTVFVYGTTDPREDETLLSVLKWSQDGQGGDKRGKLLGMNNFDDGRCYQVNASPIHAARQKATPNYKMGQTGSGNDDTELWCETDVKLPESAQVGKPYTMYWVWQWNTIAGVDPGLPIGKDEYYTTCMDVDIASPNVAMAESADVQFAMPQQDAMSVAVSDWASRTALITDAIKGELGPVFSGTPSASAPAQGSAPSLSAAPSQKSPAPARSSKGPARSSKTQVPSPKTSVSSETRASISSVKPGIPTLTQRPGADPSSGSGSVAPSSASSKRPVVTITDVVHITITASASSSTLPATTTSKRSLQPPAAAASSFRSKVLSMVTSITKAPLATAVPSSIGSPAPSNLASSKLPGFDMHNKNGAKFRRW